LLNLLQFEKNKYIRLYENKWCNESLNLDQREYKDFRNLVHFTFETKGVIDSGKTDENKNSNQIKKKYQIKYVQFKIKPI